MWAFDQTARISEYTKREPGGQDHCVRVDDLTFSLNVGDSVRGSGLYPLLVGDTPEGAVKLDQTEEVDLTGCGNTLWFAGSPREVCEMGGTS